MIKEYGYNKLTRITYKFNIYEVLDALKMMLRELYKKQDDKGDWSIEIQEDENDRDIVVVTQNFEEEIKEE